MVFVLLTLLYTSLAQHAYAEKIDAEEVEEIVLSACRMGWHRITKEIKNSKTDMEKLHNKWALDTEKRAKGDEGYWDLWKKHFAPAYRN